MTMNLHQRCRQLKETKGGVQAIVTGMRECAENRLVQERSLKLIADTCLALESFAEVGTRRTLKPLLLMGNGLQDHFFRVAYKFGTCHTENNPTA